MTYLYAQKILVLLNAILRRLYKITFLIIVTESLGK
nr:MAG TPA: hypothetical protein [Caudoviricetes sp.]